MDAFLANPGPYAPTGALSHPIVSRVFAKLNESVPREKYIAFANCPAKQKPKRRFEHKRRKLTERNVEVGGAFNKSTRQGGDAFKDVGGKIACFPSDARTCAQNVLHA